MFNFFKRVKKKDKNICPTNPEIKCVPGFFCDICVHQYKKSVNLDELSKEEAQKLFDLILMINAGKIEELQRWAEAFIKACEEAGISRKQGIKLIEAFLKNYQ